LIQEQRFSSGIEKFEITNEPVKVYNFKVNDFYTYHVGDNGILVHNVNYNEGTSKLVDNVVRNH